MAREVRVISEEEKVQLRENARKWAEKLANDLKNWGEQQGLSERAAIAKALGIPTDDRGWRTIWDGINIVGERDWLYAHIFVRTNLTSADPRTLPSTVGPGKSRQVYDRAWSEEKWQKWQQNPQAFLEAIETGELAVPQLPKVGRPRNPTSDKPSKLNPTTASGTTDGLLEHLMQRLTRQEEQINQLLAQTASSPTNSFHMLESALELFVTFFSSRIAQDLRVDELHQRIATIERYRGGSAHVELSVEKSLTDLLRAVEALLSGNSEMEQEAFVRQYGHKAARLNSILSALLIPDRNKRNTMLAYIPKEA